MGRVAWWHGAIWWTWWHDKLVAWWHGGVVAWWHGERQAVFGVKSSRPATSDQRPATSDQQRYPVSSPVRAVVGRRRILRHTRPTNLTILSHDKINLERVMVVAAAVVVVVAEKCIELIAPFTVGR